MSSALILYNSACTALAKARSLLDVKDVADKASAIKEYGRLANDRSLELNAAELRIRAERRLGEMIKAGKAAGTIAEGRPPKNCSNSEQFPRVTLDEMGIDRKLSARAQNIASISDRAIEARIARWREDAERGTSRITADLLRDDDKKARRAEREAELGRAQAARNLELPDRKYGVILADPEWRFEPYSRNTGMDRAADNHYPTSSTEIIATRPVAMIAADDCVLFLWATVPMLPDAFQVMAAWGFAYKSHAIWAKDRVGTGYWFRNKHELLLVGTKGSVVAPAMGTQWESLIDGPVRAHSEKPDWQYELIETYFPNLPKIELNARRARPGWDSWGLDAPHDPETGEILEAAE
jgi:N6-adenosine-specific RNA methylase IME4